VPSGAIRLHRLRRRGDHQTAWFLLERPDARNWSEKDAGFLLGDQEGPQFRSNSGSFLLSAIIWHNEVMQGEFLKSIGTIVMGIISLTASTLLLSVLIYNEDLAVAERSYLSLVILMFVVVGMKCIILGARWRKEGKQDREYRT
jgi:hypothetical protein